MSSRASPFPVVMPRRAATGGVSGQFGDPELPGAGPGRPARPRRRAPTSPPNATGGLLTCASAAGRTHFDGFATPVHPHASLGVLLTSFTPVGGSETQVTPDDGTWGCGVRGHMAASRRPGCSGSPGFPASAPGGLPGCQTGFRWPARSTSLGAGLVRAVAEDNDRTALWIVEEDGARDRISFVRWRPLGAAGQLAARAGYGPATGCW